MLNSGKLLLFLKADWPCHLGIDDLNVVRSIGRLLDAYCSAKLCLKMVTCFCPVRMIRARGRDTVRVTIVKGHA